jgi:GTP 3',8-cyclase
MNELTDAFGRRITYLRLSVTDRCDLRCTYCMPERMKFTPRAEALTRDELLSIASSFIARGVRKIRLTGGEPLVRRDIVDLVRDLGQEVGRRLEELTLTTNGTRLAELAPSLRACGVRRINVSLDTRDRGLFMRLTRRDGLSQVLEGISAASVAGLAVKLNVVALKGMNQDELPSLIEWAHAQGHAVTLIEVMPLGEVEEDRYDHHLPLDVVRAELERNWTLRPSDHRTGGPARYYDVVETGGQLGLITPLTNNFCAGCNRVRVTATGKLFMCLGGEESVDLRAALRSGEKGAVDRAIDEAMRGKRERHEFMIDRRGASPAVQRHMSSTGG